MLSTHNTRWTVQRENYLIQLFPHYSILLKYYILHFGSSVCIGAIGGLWDEAGIGWEHFLSDGMSPDSDWVVEQWVNIKWSCGLWRWVVWWVGYPEVSALNLLRSMCSGASSVLSNVAGIIRELETGNCSLLSTKTNVLRFNNKAETS